MTVCGFNASMRRLTKRLIETQLARCTLENVTIGGQPATVYCARLKALWRCREASPGNSCAAWESPQSSTNGSSARTTLMQSDSSAVEDCTSVRKQVPVR